MTVMYWATLVAMVAQCEIAGGESREYACMREVGLKLVRNDAWYSILLLLSLVAN